jgi:hypothetical protein
VRYILGGGIAGLIAAFYNPEYSIISDNVGGQMAEQHLGPRILEVNRNSENLLKDLGYSYTEISSKIKVAKIGYVKCGILVDKITAEDRLNYYKKSRCLSNVVEVPSSVMSDNKNEITYFDIDWNQLIDRLMYKITQNRFIFSKAFAIDTAKKEIGINLVHQQALSHYLKYDHLISTLPAPLFFGLSQLDSEEPLVYSKKVFVVVNNFSTREFDYLYVVSNTEAFHRITKHTDDLCIAEYTIPFDLSDSEYKERITEDWGMDIKEYKEIKTGQIVSGKVQKIDGITFVGRYACWDHDIKTDDVVEQLRGGCLDA